MVDWGERLRALVIFGWCQKLHTALPFPFLPLPSPRLPLLPGQYSPKPVGGPQRVGSLTPQGGARGGGTVAPSQRPRKEGRVSPGMATGHWWGNPKHSLVGVAHRVRGHCEWKGIDCGLGSQRRIDQVINMKDDGGPHSHCCRGSYWFRDGETRRNPVGQWLKLNYQGKSCFSI